jgi:hypothetical protein
MNRWSHLPKKENRAKEQTSNNMSGPAHPYADIDQTGSDGGSAGIVQVSYDNDPGCDQRDLSDL